MSQSPSSTDSRKRKEINEPTTSGESPQSSRPKRRRTKLSLKRNDVEGWSASFVDNSSQEDEDSQSATLNYSKATESQKNESKKDYQFYASKFGIQLKTVKKYYEIFATEPRVSLLRAVPIKKELSPIPSDENSRLSPILSFKRRLRKPKIKKENITSKTRDVSKRASENIEEYFKSFPAVKIKEEVLSSSESENQAFNSSAEFQISLSQSSTKDLNHLNSSENDFKKTRSKNTKNFVNSDKNTSLVTNPFSKNKNKDSSKKYPEMRRNKKTLSTNDKITKKQKKLTEIFGNEKSNASLIEDLDCAIVTDITLQKKIDTKEKAKKLNEKKNKEIKLTKVKIENEEEMEAVNSLSVNCQSLFGISNINVKRSTATTTTSANYCEESPVSFGARAANDEADDKINLDQPTSLAGNNVQSDKENGNALNSSLTNSNTDDESHNLNSSFVSLGICSSPIKLDIKSPIRKSPIRCSTPENKSINDITKPKAKPKIISDKIISKFPEKSVIPGLNLSQKRLQLKTRPNSPVTCNKPSKLEKLCSSSEAINIDDSPIRSQCTNGTMKKVPDSKLVVPSKTSAREGWTVHSVPAAKLNFDKTLSQKGGKEQTHRVLTESSVDESFDSICQDICELSSNDNITLYKGEQNEDDYTKDRQTSLNLKRYDLQNKKCLDLSSLFGDDATKVETPATNGSTKKSPIKFQPSPRMKFRLKQNIDVRSPSPVSSAVALPKQQQQQQNEAKSSKIPVDSSILEVRNNAPRLNRSFSPKSTINVKDSRMNGLFSELDPRLNRSASPTKTPVIKDPRLLRGNSQPRTSIPSVSLIESPEKDDSSRETIVDPRLRKRKEREEAEQAAKMAKEENEKPNDSSIFVFPQNCQLTSKRSTIFDRLGAKPVSPEKDVKPEKDVIQNIVKDARSGSPTKSTTSDNEDNISLFAGEMFSSDEESNASPRHRKFTSERLRVNEEIRNQPISLKDRIGWNNSAVHRKPTMPTPVTTPVCRPPVTTRLSLNTSRPLRTPIQPVNASIPQQTSTNIMSSMAKTSTKITFNDFGNNDSAFNENFYKMNTAQMQKDVANLRSQQDFESTPYITFGNNNATQYDHKSILDGPEEQSVTSVAEKNNVRHFFTKYCFKFLKTGKCDWQDAGRCEFNHRINLLKLVLEKKTEKEVIPILDYAFSMNYDHFISFVWESILPILQDSAFFIFQKLYNRKVVMIDKYLLKLLDYCINSKLHTVESFVKRISTIVNVDDSNMVRSICAAIKGKLTDGFCWEAIKDLCQKAVPPRDMIELTLLQCLQRKKNKMHIMEINDLITKKMKPAERNVLSRDLLMKFYNLVRSLNAPSGGQDPLSTVPLSIPAINANKDRMTLSRVSAPPSRSASVDSAQSLELEKTAPSTSGTSTAKVKRKISSIGISPIRTDTPSIAQPNNSPLEPGASTPQKGETTNFSEYSPTELDVEEPKSIYRDRFWKLYVTLHSVSEGLNHQDYEYVWKVMDEFSKQEETEALKHAYYVLLCKNVRSSEQHLSEIIKQAGNENQVLLSYLRRPKEPT